MPASTCLRPTFSEEQIAEERLYKEIFYEEYKRKHEAEIRNKIKNKLKIN